MFIKNKYKFLLKKLGLYLSLCLYLCQRKKQTLKQNDMTTSKLIRVKKATIAKSIKKAMKAYGIKVLRCSQNGLGVLVTICSEPNNQRRASKFCAEFDLFKGGVSLPKVVNTNLKYVDYGTLFRMEDVK